MKLFYSLTENLGMVCLAILFFCLITPLAILMRYSGRDKLRLTLADKDSYWILQSNKTNIGSFKRQS